MFANATCAYVLWLFLGIFGAHVSTARGPSLAPLRTPSARPTTAPHHLAPNPPSLQRFYVGRPVSGLVWLFTGGLLGVGWVVDFFLLRDCVEGAWGVVARCVCVREEEGASVSRRVRRPRHRCR